MSIALTSKTFPNDQMMDTHGRGATCSAFGYCGCLPSWLSFFLSNVNCLLDKSGLPTEKQMVYPLQSM